jgi:hypothetical protein
MRTIDWVDGAVEIVDPTAPPATTIHLRLSTVDGGLPGTDTTRADLQ